MSQRTMAIYSIPAACSAWVKVANLPSVFRHLNRGEASTALPAKTCVRHGVKNFKSKKLAAQARAPRGCASSPPIAGLAYFGACLHPDDEGQGLCRRCAGERLVAECFRFLYMES